MTIVSFDVAKDSLVGVRIDDNATVKENFTLANTEEAVSHLLDSLQSTYSSLLLGAESTGDCHRLLAKECLTRAIPLRLINPITTKQFTRATVRGKKTDVTDALIIAKLMLQGEGRELTRQSLDKGRPLLRTAERLVKVRQSLLAVTKRFTAVLPEETELTTEMTRCLTQLEGAIKKCRTEGARTIDPNEQTLLTSIPGIGETIANLCLSEIETINRFTSAKALVAYAGLDPRVKQSGKGLKHNTALTKRGSPLLRYALFLAASIARQHDAELAAYYQKKRNEGRHYKEVIVMIARKIAYRIYAVLKRKEVYVKRDT